MKTQTSTPPTLPYEPGHEDARSCGREGTKTLPKKEREIPKKCYPIFPGNNTDNISERGDIHEPPTVTSHGKEGRRTNAEGWPKDQTPGRKK